jgi:NADH-quinone oxidoreductase subunit K
MSGPPVEAWVALSAALFAVGLFGVLTRKNLVALLLGVELMANAANLNMVALAHFSASPFGQAAALFSIALTVAEVVVGLAIVVLLARTHKSVDADAPSDLEG